MKAERIQIRCGHIDILATPEEFPLGARGARPVRFTLTDPAMFDRVKEYGIPGVVARGRRIECTFDAAIIVADLLEEPDALTETINLRCACAVPLPGLEKYKALGLQNIRHEYQGEGARYIVRRAYALLGDPPRAGKCIQILIVVVLLDAKRVLIICPSIAKYVWAEEISKWVGESAVLLFGRAGTEARFFCMTCNGAGLVPSSGGEKDEVGLPIRVKCAACRGLGEHIRRARMLEGETIPRVYYEEPTEKAMGKWNATHATWLEKERVKREEWQTKESKRFAEWEARNPKRRKPFEAKSAPKVSLEPEKPKGQRRVERIPVAGVFRCPVHKDETDTVERVCSQCRRELFTAIESRRFVVVNYDILAAQRDVSDTGASFVRDDLPGWGPILARLNFDICIADELHRVRGWAPNQQSKQQSRRELCNEVSSEISRVYGLTGTPVYGFTRDLWAQLDFLSKGLWS